MEKSSTDFLSGSKKIEAQYKSTEKERLIFVYYSTTDVSRQKETLLMNATDFLNGLGGNMGLFLGFSCMSGMLAALNQVKRLFK